MAPPSLSKDSLAEAMGLIDDTTKIPLSVSLEASKFLANGHPILTEVPPNITTTTPSSSDKLTKTTPSLQLQGCFVGFRSESPRSQHVVPIGKLKGIRFMSIFRFKVWWTTHWTGTCGNDVEHETQMLLLENSDYGRPYVLLLPLLEGPFRASLQPSPEKDNHVAVCMESGSTQVCSSHFKACLYMHVGNDPFTLVKDAMKVVSSHLGTFKLLEEKSLPGIVDKFGWCTWDAFYLKVDPNGVWEGVKGLVEGGCSPGFVLIDDGWQSICQDDESITEEDQGISRTVAGEQMPCRLIKFEENYKFKNYQSLKYGSCNSKGMEGFIRELKEEFKCVEYVYVWHALCGYWGGIRPKVPGLPYSKVVRPKLSKGLQMTMEDLAVDKIVENGVGLVPPELVHELYEGLHSHLASVGIDGVKIDVIHLLEMLCEEYGGRIELAKAFYKALTASVRKHFEGNGVIASMQQCNDFMFLGTETISLGRAGDDFWCTDPSGDPNGLYWLQGCHMVHCAYNSLWLGNFIQPDWDMFQSTHPCAAFHAASRAISGGPIYVSDAVGNHDFELLKSLVLPDGSILRCQTYALPTKDCLFENPLHDGKTMLKIWNLNKYTGVIGAFNCQGGGWCPESRRNRSFSHHCNTITCVTSPKDIEWISGKHPIRIKGVDIFAVYMHKENQLKLMKATDKLEISLDSFDFNLLTFSPVTVLPGKSVQFAPIGLVNMLNAGGAIQSMSYDDDDDIVKIEVRGTGEMKAFASVRPTACKIDGADAEFSYKDSLVSVQVPWQVLGLSVVEYLF